MSPFKACGLLKNGSWWYRKHSEFVWVIHPRRVFNGGRIAVEVGIAFAEFSPAEWPKEVDCLFTTSYEKLGGSVPEVSTDPRYSGRGSYFTMVLDSRHDLIPTGEREAAIQFLTNELCSTTSEIDSLAGLAEFFRHPDVRRPSMDKRVRQLLGSL